MIRYSYFEGALVGRLLMLASERGVAGLYMQADRQKPMLVSTQWRFDTSPFENLCTQLDAYFAGTLRDFDVELDLVGTPFQLAVWQALRARPYGTTISYGELARRVGNPRAVRAVGLANGRNPVSIIVPCHRVIGANGALTGYGGGLDNKRLLLQIEAPRLPGW